MLHFLHLLRSILYTVLIMGIPMMIMTGGKISTAAMQHPAFQFLALIVFAYAAAPVISDFAGGHVGRSLFFPNRANLDHPTMSHIISLRNKRHYPEALEELRMLTDLHPEELEPYKMLLHLTAHELPDRRTFDMIYRKGMMNLGDQRQCELLSRFREEHVQHKENSDEEWHETSHKEKHTEGTQSVDLFVNKRHHEEKKRSIGQRHSATLPSRNKITPKDEVASIQKLILAKIAQDYTAASDAKTPKVTDQPVTPQNLDIEKDTVAVPVQGELTPLSEDPTLTKAPSLFSENTQSLFSTDEFDEDIIMKGFGDDADTHTPVQFVFKRKSRRRS